MLEFGLNFLGMLALCTASVGFMVLFVKLCRHLDD